MKIRYKIQIEDKVFWMEMESISEFKKIGIIKIDSIGMFSVL